MAMQHWNPVREMAAFDRAIDRMFEDTWQQIRNSAGSMASLPIDVHETDRAYTITAAAPGMKAEDLQINLHENVLTITGELRNARTENDEKTGRTLLTERTYGKFSRSLRLPQPVQADQIEASLEHGVLTLNLPKTPEVQPRQIPVRVGGQNTNGGSNPSNN